MKKPITTADFLEAYSRGEIGSGETIRGIGARDFRHLLELMGVHNLPLPRGRGQEEDTEREVAIAVPLLQAQLNLVEGKS
jgi:hypothetical protein